MKTTSWFGLLAAVGMAVMFWAFSMGSAADPSSQRERSKQMNETFRQGNYKEAYEGFRRLALDPQNNPRLVGNDLNMAVQCLRQLNRVDEIDALLEETVKVHKRNWWLLWNAAQNYMKVPHHGFIVAGKFQRGNHRGGGRVVNATERDRVRALQLMVQAMPLAMKDEDHGKVGNYLQSLAGMLLNNRGYRESWRLQYLTDLGVLPDYDEGWGYYHRTSGAPVDADGKPVFYYIPKSFEASETDGQRWRWCLQQAVEMNPQRLNSVRYQFAQFLQNQFGVQTMAQSGWRFGRMATDDTREDESGVYALHTLGENETIARLATGIKRFELPDEFNDIKIFQQIAAEPRTGYGIESLERLAQVFENRRQYPKAADYWRRLLKEYPNQHVNRRKDWQQRLDQIVDNWGRFEPAQTQPADRGASVEYRFRNGTQIELTAHEIKVEKLLDDVKAFLKSNPKKLNWQKINIGNIGHRLIQENQSQYIGRRVAQWNLAVEPRENHFDKRVTIATPLQKPGAYLVTAKMAGGNTSFIVLWVNDTAIVKKPLSGKTLYYVADAVSGKPVAKANVEFFGWRQIYHNKPRRHEIVTKNFAEYTDADGQIVLDARQTLGGPAQQLALPEPATQAQVAGRVPQQPVNMQWLVMARTKGGRFAYLGFTRVWYGRLHDAEYRATKVYTITDRPVYRPDQKVQYKFWVRHAQYDMTDASQFANQTFTVEIYNPKGEKIVSETKKTDNYGGIEGEYALPTDAALGVYRLNIKNRGGGSFRVEEYKKPEFEVIVDAPEEPVMLGEKITATIKAKYYFGSPVTKAKVKYKIHRSSHDERWYPVGPWDWFYGPGYWWFAYDYDWYPGWKSWGCSRPIPFWWPSRRQPSELIADQEVEIGPDGTVHIEIDTAVAKAIHPDQDHRYTITAEVVDESRRTIVGSGTVLVARKPFRVYAWVDRGYYRVGDTVAAHFSARTLDGKPVEGRGELQLLKIRYKDGKPIETPVQTWSLDTSAEGTAQQQMTASEAGQYRLSYKLTDAKEHTIEGGYLFTIIGEGFDGAQFRFNHLELIPDKREYAPGDTVKLQINTDRAGGTVLLFLRPANGVYLPPKMIRLDGKSTVETIGVVKKDMPNFFVEAVAVADGRVHVETKEIVVPPEKRVLGVEIEPSKEAYKPGEKAKVQLKLTDLDGRPFVGSTVVAIYDKSVEYISGGSNVPEIKEFFWKWRRRHNPRTESSLGRWCRNLIRRKTIGMSDLGVFGGSVVEDIDQSVMETGIPTNGQTFGMGGGMRGGRVAPELAAPMMDAAMPDAPMASMAMRSKGTGPGGGEGGSAPMVQPTVRTKFADTALWVGALTTKQDGTAEVSLEMPENLTTWRIKVWGMGQGTRVGQGFTDVVTRKDLIIRLQAPRFFVQTDEVVLSAVVHNYLKSKKKVHVSLYLGGKCLDFVGAVQWGRQSESRSSPTARPGSIGASKCSTRARRSSA